MRILHPDPLVDAELRMAEALAESMFGQDGEARVESLRRSILKDECPPSKRLSGLAGVLEYKQYGDQRE